MWRGRCRTLGKAAYRDLCHRPAGRFRERISSRLLKLLPVLALVGEIRMKNRRSPTLLETYVG